MLILFVIPGNNGDRNDPGKLAEKLEQLTTAKAQKPSEAKTGFSTPAANPKNTVESRGEYSQSPIKKLGDIMKTELLADKTEEEIKMVSLQKI